MLKIQLCFLQQGLLKQQSVSVATDLGGELKRFQMPSDLYSFSET